MKRERWPWSQEKGGKDGPVQGPLKSPSLPMVWTLGYQAPRGLNSAQLTSCAPYYLPLWACGLITRLLVVLSP